MSTQRTSCRVKVFEIWTVPLWVTKAVSPLGKLTWACNMEVIEVRHVTECSMWFVAPLSMIRSDDLKDVLSITSSEKMECYKVDLNWKDVQEKIPDWFRMKLVWEIELAWGCEEVPMPRRPSRLEVFTASALKLELEELRKTSSCSHWVLEMGHYEEKF